MNNKNISDKKYKVIFLPFNKIVNINKNSTLLNAAQKIGLPLASACGGVGKCGQCRIKILKGNVSSISNTEKNILSKKNLEEGLRLACLTKIKSKVKVLIPDESIIINQKLQLTSEYKPDINIESIIKTFTIKVPHPSLKDSRSDLVRLTDALPELKKKSVIADIEVIKQISIKARKYNWELTVLVKGPEIIGIIPKGVKPVGVAIDLGTTKIAVSLIDLENGKEIAVNGELNPQITYGEDIISRLMYSIKNPEGSKILSSVVITLLENLIEDLTSQIKIDREQIAEICLVGNPAMTHLLFNLPVNHLSVSPYVAPTHLPIEIKARNIGLSTAPGAYVYVLPGIGGFVGADHTAMILANNLDLTDQISLGLDIGTNTEVVLTGKNRKLTTTSCASGPAFEGVHVKHGMRASTGAIEKIILTEKGIKFQTIDNKPPVGICGSGIIDLLAEFLKFNIINFRGRFDQKNAKVISGKQGPEFLLIPSEKSGNKKEITFTQEDINQIQLAKGAIRVGIEILLESNKISLASVKQVVFAGAFGSYLNINNAIKIGLLPNFPNADYIQSGNASLTGARKALISKQARARAYKIAKKAQCIELALFPDFNLRFAESMYFRG